MFIEVPSSRLCSIQQLQTEVHNFESKVSRLKVVKGKLSENKRFGAMASMDRDMSRLEVEWVRVLDVARGSLDTLWAEHSEWVSEMLSKMDSVLSEGRSLLEKRVKFVDEYPLKQLMASAAKRLLEEVQEFLTHEVLQDKCCIVFNAFLSTHIHVHCTCILYMHMYMLYSC